jgi:hypothetical protein
MVTIISCKSGDKSGIQVPKESAFVFHLNNSSLSGKLSWNEIKSTKWFKEAYAEQNDSLLRKLLDDPDNSGIDTKANMVLFIKKQGRGGYLGFEGTLKDLKAFEEFNKKTYPQATITKDGDGIIVGLQDDRVIAYTQGTRFIYIVDLPLGMATSMIPGTSRSESFRFSKDSLVSFAKTTFSLSGKDNLTSDDRFSDLIKSPGDVHVWMNNEQYFNMLGAEILSMMKVGDIINGQTSASVINFENGKITFDSKTYLNEKMAGLIKKYPPKKISADMINRIPSRDVAAVFAMNYSPEGLKELLKLAGVDGMVNGQIEKLNYSLDEFIRANKGDMVIAVSDFVVKKQEVSIGGEDGGKPYTYTTSKPDVKVLFATSVNDKAAFDKLITTLASQMPEGNGVTKEISYQIDKNWFVASNSADYNAKFLAGASNQFAFAGRLADHGIGMYVDINKLIKGAGAELTSDQDKAQYEAALKMWQDAWMTGGDYKDGATTGHLEINLVDKNVNSLKQINQWVDQMAEIKKRNDQSAMSPSTVDSTVTVAPPQAEPLKK